MAAPSPQPLPRLVRACRGETLERPPVWFMRQAGRYMSEYRAIREKTGFLELCKSVDLATEVSLQPYRAFGVDAVILFSDILIPVEAMGQRVEFVEGPHLPQPLRSRADVARLGVPDPMEKTGFVMDILNTLRRELASSPDTALIGFAGAPWTLASYMIEGGTSRHFLHLKRLMLEDPAMLHQLLEMLSDTVARYLNAQIAAGAQVVQLFDTWAGILSPAQYREFVLPYHQRIISTLDRDAAPVILYVNGSAHVLEAMAEAGADVLSLDPTHDLAATRARLGPAVPVQGNLDPALLFAAPEALLPRVRQQLADGGNRGYVFNLGHGILPGTPVETVRQVTETVKAAAEKQAATA